MRKLTNLEIMKAKDVTLTEIEKAAKLTAERCVCATIKIVDGKRVNCGWSVDTYSKQLYKMQIILGWLNTPVEASEQVYMDLIDMDIVGQLERAEFEEVEVRDKARILYRKYLTLCDMLDDKIRDTIREAEAKDKVREQKN